MFDGATSDGLLGALLPLAEREGYYGGIFGGGATKIANLGVVCAQPSWGQVLA
jgi:hypothetical protein